MQGYVLCGDAPSRTRCPCVYAANTDRQRKQYCNSVEYGGMRDAKYCELYTFNVKILK